MNEQDFLQKLSETAKQVSQQLEMILTTNALATRHTPPRQLVEAMRHGVLNGGKRLRPFLVLECAALFNVNKPDAMTTACALECLHSYSLVHDDLPAMDDDKLRRGQPTVHIKFDEATAILAGDALLTLAFELITDDSGTIDSTRRACLASLLAKASGASGMIGGQMMDMEAELATPDETQIRTLQAMKTGNLIRYACEAGAVLGNANSQQKECLVQYGESVGLAFQLADDLLDVTSNSTAMGKAVGKDANRGKGTLVAIHGVEKVQTMLENLVREAEACLEEFGGSADALRQAARYIAQRKN